MCHYGNDSMVHTCILQGNDGAPGPIGYPGTEGNPGVPGVPGGLGPAGPAGPRVSGQCNVNNNICICRTIHNIYRANNM